MDKPVKPGHPVLGESSMIIASLFFAVTSILVKSASSTFSGMFIVMVRFIVNGLVLALIVTFSRQGWKITMKKAWLMRGLFGAVAMALYYMAIAINGSGRATLLQCTYPVFVMVTGLIFFKKGVVPLHIISLVVTLAGIVLVLYDGSRYNLLGDLLALSSAIFAGFAVNYIRILRESDHSPAMIYLPACLFGLFIGLYSLGEVTRITPVDLAILLAVAFSVLAAQITMTFGYKYVSANRGSIYSLLIPPLSIFLSFLLGEEIKTRFIIGGSIVLIGLVIQKVPQLFSMRFGSGSR
jgi:drug/metabolite transporter (DMT)-like permease